MAQENFIIELFCRVDGMLPRTNEHIQAKLSISELIALRLLFALKGTSQHAFYRRLGQNWSDLIPNLPERTGFFRRLKTQRKRKLAVKFIFFCKCKENLIITQTAVSLLRLPNCF